MYNKELRDALASVHKNMLEINKRIVDIKIAVHTMDKLGRNVEDYYKLIDDLGIEYRRLFNHNLDVLDDLKNNG